MHIIQNNKLLINNNDCTHILTKDKYQLLF